MKLLSSLKPPAAAQVKVLQDHLLLLSVFGRIGGVQNPIAVTRHLHVETAQQINANKYQRSRDTNVRPAASTRLTGSARGRREVHGPVDQCASLWKGGKQHLPIRLLVYGLSC